MNFRSSHFADARTLRLLALILAALMSLTSGCRKDVEFDDDRPAAELYADAKQALDSKSWDQAIRTYKYLQTRYPFGRYTEQSMLDLSYAYFKGHEGQNALSTLNRFIRTYPTHPNVDYAFYLKGLVNYEENLGFLERLMPKRVRDRDQTRLRDAFVDFSELLRRYPDSRYVPDARQRMVYLRNNLAAYEVGVANFYMGHQAYIASANRARFALETYPNTPENEEALVMLHQSYVALNLTELADTTMQVLKLNYPDNYYVLGEKKKRDWLDWLWPFD
jgi:outer membrane protein assembly factor BamD